MTKIEIHKRLGLTTKRTDEIFDDVIQAYQKNYSLQDAVEFVAKNYNCESVVAGMTLDILITKVLCGIEGKGR